MGNGNTKKDFIKDAEKIFEQARTAYSYFEILNQYNKNLDTYNNEYTVSTAFYSYTKQALITASFLEIYKIYDTNKGSKNIKKIFDNLEQRQKWYPKDTRHTYDGEDKEWIFPHTYKPKQEELEFFKIELKKKPVLFPNDNSIIVDVDMTIADYFTYYNWRYEAIVPILENMTKQRNKFHAHNDSKYFNNSDLISEDYPITYKDMEKLLLFPLEFCQFSIAMLTDVWKEFTVINLDDWENTLETVRNGNKFNALRIDIAKIVFKNHRDLKELVEEVKKEPKNKKLVEDIEIVLKKYDFDSYRTLKL
ncbi:hypothetical protein RAK27_12305 [Carnobacterium maltaromaticum]|uniref:HEPN domain-containing protein n=1 Tax=Carnobacterium maltaromaticum TaxID=2751 RepID=A0AAW9K3W4_CARML|nr:hypothetical protein [Carnobacterium maltaromaticum]MDZ5759436.1 hypothetical protein [Carnobacterium maltaromaticum]